MGKGFISERKTKWDFHPEETYKSLIAISVEALKTLALVNGGAAVAILAFLGNFASRPHGGSLPSMIWALSCFAGGLFFTILAFIFSYLTQLQLYNEDLAKDDQQSATESQVLSQPAQSEETLKVPLGQGRTSISRLPPIPQHHRFFLNTAIGLVILAALAFAAGCVLAALVFEKIV